MLASYSFRSLASKTSKNALTAWRFDSMLSAEAAFRKCFTKHGHFYKIFDNAFCINTPGDCFFIPDKTASLADEVLLLDKST